jgi:hypothetical protein
MRLCQKAEGSKCSSLSFAAFAPFMPIHAERYSSGRMGGQKNRRLIPDSASEAVPAPRTAEDVKNLLAETMAGIHARRVDPKIGNVMLERRITVLEKRSAMPKEH